MFQEAHTKQTASRATVTLALVLLIFLGAEAGFAAAETLPLEVTPASADVGHMLNASSVELEFTITNTGDQPVRLIYIYAQCDCSLNIPDKGLVPAMGQFILRGQLMVGEGENGLLEEQITILTDHPSQKELIIPVTALVTEVN